MSEPVELCQEDAETFMVPDLAGLACTENGLAINGVPIAGAGGSSGGTGGAGMGGGTTTGGTDAGGSATGGVETGGTDNAGGSSAGAETGGSSAGGASTGGTDNTAGAAEPDDSESRTIMTEGGCGCRTPTQPRERHSALWLALVLSLLAFQRRRARR
jgi:MYXO-CTERM domain-containing protein